METRKNTSFLENKKLNIKEFNIKPLTALNTSHMSAKNIYYFDENMIMRIVPAAEAFGKIDNLYHKYGEYFATDMFHLHEIIGENDLNLFRTALFRTKDGDTFKHFLKICRDVRYIKPSSQEEWINRFIGKIERPSFERETGNSNPDTFDFIRVGVCLTKLDEDMKFLVEKYYSKIIQKVLEKIEKSQAFKKYGIPINFLKVTKATLSCQDTLEIIFELKSMSK